MNFAIDSYNSTTNSNILTKKVAFGYCWSLQSWTENSEIGRRL